MIVCSIYYMKRPGYTKYPEGEKMLENWRNEKTADGAAGIITLEEPEDEPEPTLLDRLDDALNTPDTAKRNGDGFSVNLDAFNDKSQ